MKKVGKLIPQYSDPLRVTTTNDNNIVEVETLDQLSGQEWGEGGGMRRIEIFHSVGATASDLGCDRRMVTCSCRNLKP